MIYSKIATQNNSAEVSEFWTTQFFSIAINKQKNWEKTKKKIFSFRLFSLDLVQLLAWNFGFWLIFKSCWKCLLSLIVINFAKKICKIMDFIEPSSIWTKDGQHSKKPLKIRKWILWALSVFWCSRSHIFCKFWKIKHWNVFFSKSNVLFNLWEIRRLETGLILLFSIRITTLYRNLRFKKAEYFTAKWANFQSFVTNFQTFGIVIYLLGRSQVWKAIVTTGTKQNWVWVEMRMTDRWPINAY